MDGAAQSRSASSIRNFLTTLKLRVQEPTPEDAPSSKHYFDSVNMYGNIQEDDTLEELDEEEPSRPHDDAHASILASDDPENLDIETRYPIRTRKQWYQRLGRFFIKQQDWFFLLVLGLCSAIIALAVEEIIRWIFKGSF